jgi:hypothetical protein
MVVLGSQVFDWLLVRAGISPIELARVFADKDVHAPEMLHQIGRDFPNMRDGRAAVQKDVLAGAIGFPRHAAARFGFELVASEDGEVFHCSIRTYWFDGVARGTKPK